MAKLTKKRILLIEDDEYIRDIYQEVLTNEGIQVDISVDGDEGLAKVQEITYDLVLLDIMMPKLDGIGFLKVLKESKAKTQLNKIILLTNLAQSKVIKKGLSLGAKTYLVKTDFTPHQLVEKIKTFLK